MVKSKLNGVHARLSKKPMLRKIKVAATALAGPRFGLSSACVKPAAICGIEEQLRAALLHTAHCRRQLTHQHETPKEKQPESSHSQAIFSE